MANAAGVGAARRPGHLSVVRATVVSRAKGPRRGRPRIFARARLRDRFIEEARPPGAPWQCRLPTTPPIQPGRLTSVRGISGAFSSHEVGDGGPQGPWGS